MPPVTSGFSRLTNVLLRNRDGSLLDGGPAALVAVLTATVTLADGITTVARDQFRFPVRQGVPYLADGLWTNPAEVPATETATPADVAVSFYQRSNTDDRLRYLFSAIIPEESGGNPVDWEDLVPLIDLTSNLVTALPTASASYRGVVLLLKGTAGNPDVLYICLKRGVAGDATYAWEPLTAEPQS